MNPVIEDKKEMAITELLPWSTPKRVDTKRGPKILRTAAPNETFWSVWRRAKEALKEAGVSVFCPHGTQNWQVSWWQSVAPEEQQVTQSRIAESRAEANDDPSIVLPCPEGLEYLPYQRAGIIYALKAFGDL